MEIERKYLIPILPEDFTAYPSKRIEQGYLCTEPVIRIRRLGDDYILTYKSKGLMVREEQEFPLTAEAYQHLCGKIDGILISKTRYFIPYGKHYTIELDIFHGEYEHLILAEVEFGSEAEANNFTPPDWFGEEVTFSGEYQNSRLALGGSGSIS